MASNNPQRTNIHISAEDFGNQMVDQLNRENAIFERQHEETLAALKSQQSGHIAHNFLDKNKSSAWKGLQPGEVRPGTNFVLFVIFAVFHGMDMTTSIRQSYGGFSYGVAIWLVLMPLLANLLLEAHKEPGLAGWFKDYWKYAKWGLGSLLVPVLEGPLSFLLGSVGTGLLNIGDIGVVTATIAVYFPLGLMPFAFSEHARAIGKIPVLGQITNLRIFVGLYMMIMFFTLMFYSSDKIDDGMQIVNDFMAEKFGYDPTVPASERATLPVLEFMKETGIHTYEKAKSGLFGAKAAAFEGGKKLVLGQLGDSYTGKVDSKAKQKIGVYLEDAKSTEQNFFTDKQTIVYTRLRAETLDNPINIVLNCEAANSKAGIVKATKIYPRSEFNIATMEDESIDCIFDPLVLSSGPYVVNITADFDFTTLAYIKSYFVEKGRLRAYTSEGIDPFAENGITEKAPVAIYSNGPIMIGLGLNREQPITLDRSLPTQRYTFGITLKNMWKDSGEVKEIKNITIILPEGFALSAEQPHTTREISCEDIPQEESCEESTSNIYQITPEKGFDKEYTYRIYMEVAQGDYDNVLGNTPMITQYFKVMVDYTYELEEVRSVKVFEPEPIQSSGGTATTHYSPPMFTAYAAPMDSITATTAKITWTTDVNSTGIIQYWHDQNPSLIFNAENTTLATQHSKDLTEGLSPQRTYLWRITAKNEYDQTTESDLKSFTTKAIGAS